MVMKNRRECDVFGTTRAVDIYGVKVHKIGDESDILCKVVDLSPRGLARLEKFIRRGMRAPSEGERDEQKKGGDDAASTHGQTSLMPNLQGLGEPAESEES